MPQSIIKKIEPYLNRGDKTLMDKVRVYLIETLNIDNITANEIRPSEFYEVAEFISTHIDIDIENIKPDSPKYHIKNLTSIIKIVFLDFIKIIERDEGNIAALEFIETFEESIKDADWTCNGCLGDFIKIFDFGRMRSKYLPQGNLIPQKKSKTWLEWNPNKDEKILKDLGSMIYEDYEIIRSRFRFEQFFLRKGKQQGLKVNQNKIGHFVRLIYELHRPKNAYLISKGGKGFWIYLSQNTYDFDGKLLDKNNSKFKTLSSNIDINKDERYSQIINEVDEILRQILL